MSGRFSLRYIISILVIVVGLLAQFVPIHSTLAAVGLPGSPEFGYGARLDLQGQGIRQALELAAGMNLTWLLVEFDWNYYWPNPDAEPIWNQLDSVAQLAQENYINLGISISNPPAWAITAQGPDPEKTSSLALQLARRYDGIVLAIELFPGANTLAGWLVSPNPNDFTILLHTVSVALTSADFDIQLITTLSPVLPENHSTDIADQVYLSGLYEKGWQSQSSILGIHYDKLTGDILQSPAQNGLPVLRHYEELRNILVQYHDEQRLIWITGFSWPVELMSEELDMKQASWLMNAYRLLTAQLYIGAAFFEQINPNSTSEGNFSLLQPDATLHPACSLISQLTNSTNIIVPYPEQKVLLLSSMSKIISK